MRRLLVVLATLAVTSPLVPAGAGAHAAADTDPPPVKHATRQYGDGPVKVAKDQVLLLRFRGHQGDRVTFTTPRADSEGRVYYGGVSDNDMKLLDASGRATKVSPDVTGFFRLPRTGWFNLRYHQPFGGGWVQLTLQKRVTARPGEVLSVPKRLGYQYLVRLHVPQAGMQLASFGYRTWGYVAGGRFWETFGGSDEPLLLAPGFPVVTGRSQPGIATAPEPGDIVKMLLDPSARARVEVRAVDATTLELDGDLVDVPLDYRSTVSATFWGQAGQFVQLQSHGTAEAWQRPIILFGPGHRIVDSGNYLNDVYQLPYTGTYTAVPMSNDPDELELAVRLASLVDVGEVQRDGEPLVVDAQPDGRLVLAHVGGDSWAHAQATADTLGNEAWSAFVGVFSFDCPPRGPLGCGDGTGAFLTRAHPVTTSGVTMDVVVVDTASSTSGSVTIALTSTPPT